MIKAEELQKYLGNRIKKYRRERNMSQEQLAENIGIATNSLSSIETGNSFMTIYTMTKILNVLNISPRELFDFPEISDTRRDKKEYIESSIDNIAKDKEKLAILYNIVRLLN